MHVLSMLTLFLPIIHDINYKNNIHNQISTLRKYTYILLEKSLANRYSIDGTGAECTLSNTKFSIYCLLYMVF